MEDPSMRIEKLMSHHVTTCSPRDSLEHAASLMWNSDCGCIPVTAPGSDRVVGIITDRDICMAALFRGNPLRDLRVEDAMARNVLTCRASDKVEDAQRQMENDQIRRLPVLGNDGELIGIVSMADIAREAASSQFKQHQEISASDVTATLARISTSSTSRRAA
jgi:CBS domain-containing protein